MPRANRKLVGPLDRLSGKLGVGRIRSDQDLVDLVERRLPSTAVKALIESGLTDAEAYKLILPRRTYSHRVSKNEPLTREESDRAVRVARITARAEEFFGEPDKAWRWLRKPKVRFDGKTPMEMLETEAGARLVEQLLYQVEYGMLA